MMWPLLIGSVVMAWAMLRIMGNERQNRLDIIQAEIRIAIQKAQQEAQEVVQAKAANSR